MAAVLITIPEVLVWSKKNIYDNAEVWSTLIPLLVLVKYHKQPRHVRPVIVYLLLAFPLYLLGNIIADHKDWLPERLLKWLPGWFSESNNPLYNIHSLVRFACFASFFLTLYQPSYKKIRHILPLISMAFLVVNFGILRVDFFFPGRFNSALLTIEAYLLLIYCLLYYLSSLNEDKEDFSTSKDFFIVTGLSSYVVINFFVFLFYEPVFNENYDAANRIWDIHNFAQIIFCILLAKAFYVPAYKQ